MTNQLVRKSDLFSWQAAISPKILMMITLTKIRYLTGIAALSLLALTAPGCGGAAGTSTATYWLNHPDKDCKGYDEQVAEATRKCRHPNGFESATDPLGQQRKSAFEGIEICAQHIAKLNKVGAEHAKVAKAKRKVEQELLAKEQQDMQKKLDMAEAKDNTTECKAARAKANYCGRMNMVRMFELQIEHENEIGKQVGYVNAVNLRNAASNKILYEKEATTLQNQYHQLSGQSINKGMCNIIDDQAFSSHVGLDTGSDMRKFCASQ